MKLNLVIQRVMNNFFFQQLQPFKCIFTVLKNKGDVAANIIAAIALNENLMRVYLINIPTSAYFTNALIIFCCRWFRFCFFPVFKWFTWAAVVFR